MEPIRLLDMGLVSPLRSQTVYHAVAHAMTAETPDTIILVSPANPYVCIGHHQELEKEVDLETCRARGLPVYRREVGGGAVYLDRNQIFVQWIFHAESLSRSLEKRFELYIRPLVDTYRALGVDAYQRPINDIPVAGKQIGGTGAAQNGLAEVVVGRLMLDFDKMAMAQVVKVSSEKMRDKIFQGLDQYMTTLREQMVEPPGRQALVDLYVSQAATALGRVIAPGPWTEPEELAAQELDAHFVSDEWLYQKGGLRRQGIKIHEDVRVVEGALKAPGGLIRVAARLRADHIDDLSISGDFTILPASGVTAMEDALRASPATREALTARLVRVYEAYRLESPGVTPNDGAAANLAAIGSTE
jgi:lipoate-protein ligase A